MGDKKVMSLVEIVKLFFLIYTLMMFLRILTSWIPELYELSFMTYVCQFTDPYFDIFRKIIPPVGMIDISPLFAFIALHFIEMLVLYLIV